MTRLLGWWEYDPIAPGMVNSLTGERVIYRGALGGHMRVTWSESWQRYDYVHSELTFPLVARIMYPQQGMRDEARHECLSVDYPRSARLWRDDPFGNQVVGTAPAYGVWRRVDDCLVDAFSCWPRQATGGWRGGAVELVGGWLNGVWRPDFSRVGNGGAELEKALDAAAGKMPRTPPQLMDLWDKPAPRWTLADGRKGGKRGPFLVTEDGLRELHAPEAGQDPARGAAIFTLVDRDDGTQRSIVAQASAHPAQWNVEFVAAAAAGPSLDDAWLGCHWSIIDAFGAWRTAVAANGGEAAAGGLRPPDAIRLVNCFRGGVRVPTARCHVFYTQPL